MQAKQGDKVKLHYTLKDSMGEVIETSKDLMPIEFTIGEGQVIPGIEKGVTGMKPGDTKTVTIPPEDGYGLREEKKIFEYARKNAPDNFDARVGQTVKLHRPNGRPVPVIVLEVNEKCFKMDANHPLAGKELVFDLELVEIMK
ncbi:MAG: peptidylprolyl isomerase [Nitrospirota bacterium]|nr:peptidylprolyl isomerase [Nitrospirota bacterium]